MPYTVDQDYYEAACAKSEAIEAAIPHAEAALCADVDAFSNWLAGEVGSPRKPSAYFGEMSAQELQTMALNDHASALQVQAACLELRRRYLSDNKDAVSRIAREMCE